MRVLATAAHLNKVFDLTLLLFIMVVPTTVIKSSSANSKNLFKWAILMLAFLGLYESCFFYFKKLSNGTL